MQTREYKVVLGCVSTLMVGLYILMASRKGNRSERQARLYRPLRWRMEQFISANSLLIGNLLRSRMYKKLASASPFRQRDLEETVKFFFLGEDNRPQPYQVPESVAERFIGVHIGRLRSPELLALVEKVRVIMEASFGEDVVFMHDPGLHHITVYAFSRAEEVVSLGKIRRTVEDEMKIVASVIERFPPVRIYLQDIVLTSTGTVLLLWNHAVNERTANIDALRAATLRASYPGGPVGQTQRIAHTTLARVVALRPLKGTSTSDLHNTRKALQACGKNYVGELSLECRDVFYCQETTRLSHTGHFWSKLLGVKSTWKRV